METRIFFNPGDSIANIHDYNEAVRKGQIFKREQEADDLVIAKGPDDEEYAIFHMKLKIGFSVTKTIVMENFHHDRFFHFLSFTGHQQF